MVLFGLKGLIQRTEKKVFLHLLNFILLINIKRY